MERRLCHKEQAPSPCIRRRNAETEILRERLIEDAKRVRKIDTLPSILIDLTVSDTPGGAGKIAKTIDRNDDRLIERRNVKGGG